MSIYIFCIVSWVALLLFKFLEKRQKELLKEKRFTRANLVQVSVYPFFRKFFLVAGCIYTSLILIVLLLDLFTESVIEPMGFLSLWKLVSVQSIYAW